MKEVIELEVNNWNNIFNTKKFWQEYYDSEVPYENNCLINLLGFNEETYSESNEIISPCLEIPFPRKFALILSFSLSCTYDVYLELKFPVENDDFGKITLGWDDMAHWYPDFFRLEEFEAIIKYFEEYPQPELKCEPKFVPLLLRKFTPPTSENNSILFPLTKEIIRKTNLFTPQEVEDLAEQREYILENFLWKFNPELGWLHEGEDGYSLRSLYEDESLEEGSKTKTLLLEVRRFFQALYQEIGLSK